MGTARVPARPFQRLLLFIGANETGGSAYLYRMLKTTRHPLYIIYGARRPTDGQHPCLFLQKNKDFANALAETDSAMAFYQIPVALNAGEAWIDRARKPILRFSDSHGERPLSYIFINGHDNYGHHQHIDENPNIRQLRLEKYWAPYRGALHTIAKPDYWNSFDDQTSYITTKNFISQMSTVLTSMLPLVRNDGEGVVVLKSPTQGVVNIVNSRQMRANFVNPTPHFYESAVLAARAAADQLTKRESLEKSPWPTKRNWLQLGDVFAKSAIAMYKSFTPFSNITFHRCAHDYNDIDGPVSLLLNPDIKPEASAFTKDELASASKNFKGDVEASKMSSLVRTGIIRRTENPQVLPHNVGRGSRDDWFRKELTQKYQPGGSKLVRSVFAKLSIDEGVSPNLYTPFDPRISPHIKDPKPK